MVRSGKEDLRGRQSQIIGACVQAKALGFYLVDSSH